MSTIYDMVEMRMQKKKAVKKRNVVLQIDTYERLEKYKIRLMSEKEDSSLTFDDVINNLLDKASKLGESLNSRRQN